jgi:hypothetical protein
MNSLNTKKAMAYDVGNPDPGSGTFSVLKLNALLLPVTGTYSVLKLSSLILPVRKA